eukprot:gene2383-2945_t
MTDTDIKDENNNNEEDVMTILDLTGKPHNVIGDEYDLPVTLTKLCLRQNLISEIENIDGDKLISLEYLDLYDNKIQVIKNLHNFSNLTFLDLSFNEIRVIENLSSKDLPVLNELYLANNKITDIDNLHELTTLTNLELGSNRLREIKNLDKLVSIETLWLGRNKITEIKNVSHLSKLRILSLLSNRILEVGNGLNGLTNLKELYLSHNGITNIDGLQSLKSLEILDIASNKISKLVGISELTNLEELWKPWTLISQIKKSQWKKVLLSSILNVIIVLTWNTGVKYIGPLGSILFSDYTSSTYTIIFNSLLQGSYLASDFSRASFMLVIGYLLIPLFGSTATQNDVAVGAIHILFSKSNEQHSLAFLSDYSLTGTNNNLSNQSTSGPVSTGYYLNIMKDVVRQIVEKPTSRRIFIFLLVNLSFMFVEMIYGVWNNSLGLITDACHMLFDATALFIALFAEVISQWKKNDTYSYGYGRVQVLSGFVNGIFLIFISITILMESIERLLEPPEITTDKLLLVSVLGFIVNMIGVFSFHGDHGHSHGGDHGHSHGHSHGHTHGHSKHSHGGSHAHGDSLLLEQSTSLLDKEKPKKRSVNIDGVFLHLLADTLGSVGVIVSSLIIQIWGFTLADPICSLCISILIFLSVIPLIKNTAKTLLQCTPDPIKADLHNLLQKVGEIPGVSSISNYHLWSHYEELNVGTMKVLVDKHSNEQKIRKSIVKILKEYDITQSSIEIQK